MVLTSIPSPTTSVWHLGPLPIRAYALCILAGVVLAVYVTDRRLRARGGPPGAAFDVAVWAVPFGILGARLYHVVTTSDAYFGAGGHPLDALKIWHGGLGIWGGVAGGALGAWIACRRQGYRFAHVVDAGALGLPLAQAVGRLGNWFNNELYGRPTDLPWGLRVNAMDSATGTAVAELPGTYHPTFLYEILWLLGVAGLVWWADRQFHLDRGRLFALYVMAYTVGRFWIEYLRVDETHTVLGLRLNMWTSLVVFLGALVYFLVRRAPRETVVLSEGPSQTPSDGATESPSEGPTEGPSESPSGSSSDTTGARPTAH